ncbi:MAG: MFS transporter [Pseudomonadota bacterium]
MMPSAQPTKTPFGLVLALWFAGLTAAAQFAKISVIFPLLQDVYPQAGTSIGFLVSLLSFLGIALGLVAGLLVARIGFRRMLISALLLGAAMSAFQATLPAFPLMLASRVLEGLSHLAIVVAAPTLIAQISTDAHRPMAMTLWGTFFGVAFALVAWFGTPLVEAYGPPGLFLAHSAAMITIAGVLILRLPQIDNSDNKETPLSWRLVVQRHVEIYTSPAMAAPAMGWLFYTFTFVSLLTLLPGYVAEPARAFTLAAMPLASIVSSMTIGVALLRVTSAVNVILIGFVASIAVAFALILSPGNAALCITLFATLGLVQGASFAAVPQLNESADHRAYANGALAQTGNLGNGIGTPILLTILAAGGFTSMMVTVIACYALGFGAHIWLARMRANQR